MRHRSWLAGQTFSLPVHQLVFQDYAETVRTAWGNETACREVGATMASWSPGPLVEALRGLRGLRGINVVSTATLVAIMRCHNHGIQGSSAFDSSLCWRSLLPAFSRQ